MKDINEKHANMKEVFAENNRLKQRLEDAQRAIVKLKSDLENSQREKKCLQVSQ